VRPLYGLTPRGTGQHQYGADRGRNGEALAGEEDADGNSPDGFGAEEETGPAGGGALHGPGLREEGEDTAEQGEVDQLQPRRHAGVGGQVSNGWSGEERRTDDGLDGRHLQWPEVGREAADEGDMGGAYDGGGEHEQVADTRRVEAVAGHEQADRDDADTRCEEELRRHSTAVHQRCQHERQADDQPRVGRAGVRHAVRLQHEHRRLAQTE
jgi:hypothetical protein